MKDAQTALRHANITTTANVYMQPIPASVTAAMNSRTRAVLAKKRQNLGKTSEAMHPSFPRADLQVLEKNGSSGRTRTYNPPVNTRAGTRASLCTFNDLTGEQMRFWSTCGDECTPKCTSNL